MDDNDSSNDHPSNNKPESHFPASTLSKLPLSTSSSSSNHLSTDQEAHTTTTAENMEPSAAPSGHRRRRSSAKQSYDAGKLGVKVVRPRSSKRKTSDMPEGDQDGRLSQDDSTSPSDDVLERMSEEDDEILDDEETGLTAADKGKRRGRRRRNTLLDERIVASDYKITAEEEQRLADQNVFRRSLINVSLIGLWYLFSLTISLYNKWMFDKDHLNFPFPLFTTCTHMLVQFSLASLVLFFMPQFRPRHDSISNPSDTHPTDEDWELHELESKKPLMTKQFYLTRIGPCGMATGLDIGLGNFSLRFISLTFYTMCKSSSLAFVLIFAFLFRLETPSVRLIGIIATMTVGVLLMVAGEVDFSTIGFILVISAAFFSGFRWGLTQILLLRNPATSNPFSSIFYLAPVMFVTLLIIAIPVEGFPELFEGLAALVKEKGPFLGPATLLFPGVIAFLMTASEFALLQRTSVVTLSIAGIFKEVVTITAAGLKFHDPLTVMNMVGLFVTIGAIAAYNYIKITSMREDARAEVHNRTVLTNIADVDHDGSDADGEDDWEGHGGQETGTISRYAIDDGEVSPSLQTGRSALPQSKTGMGNSRQNSAGMASTINEVERVGLISSTKKDLSD